jgi:nitrilase
LKKFIAAAVQWTPSVHDAAAGAERAVAAIAEAARAGAKLVVFPEAWLVGYPYWAGSSPRNPEFHEFLAAFNRALITVPGPEIALIQKAAARHGCEVVMGVQERGGGTIYCSQVFIGADGSLRGHHRKLMPTLTERMIWGMGDGSDLDAYETDVGRLSGLMCFEHHMAPARYALCGLGVQVHASQWPGFSFLDSMIDAATRQLAFENACFVIVAREVFAVDKLAPGMPSARSPAETWKMNGGSSIIAPNGQYLSGPVFGEETLVMAEIDLDAVISQKAWVDGVGHYARPDVFRLEWDRRRKPAVKIRDSDD